MTDAERRTSRGDQTAPSLEPVDDLTSRRMADLARGTSPPGQDLCLDLAIRRSEFPIGQTVRDRIADVLEGLDRCRRG